MRKTVIAVMLVALGLLIATATLAGPWAGGGPGRGYGPAVSSEALKNFQKETLSLRDDLVTREFELREEYGKENPDLQKVATLKKQIVDLETKIAESARNNGLERRNGRGLFRDDKDGRGGYCRSGDGFQRGLGTCWR